MKRNLDSSRVNQCCGKKLNTLKRIPVSKRDFQDEFYLCDQKIESQPCSFTTTFADMTVTA